MSHPAWKSILRSNVTAWHRLAEILQLSTEDRAKLSQNPRFICNIPLRLVEKMPRGTLSDPLIRQFVPLCEEEEEAPLYVIDPVGDLSSRKAPKLLHKYAKRVLLLPTSACAMHCRYCFRQNFPYETSQKGLEAEIAYIASDTTLDEVILSGGDPLSLDTESLASILQAVGEISHIRRIRFHTRFLIGIPERIDEPLLALFQTIRQRIYIVIHTNHPRELDRDVLLSIERLRQVGCQLLSQSVLLGGVNDEVAVLKELFTVLIDHGVLPYYLHQLDKVKGTAHFAVSQEKGEALMAELREELPGYAIPRYVEEIEGERSKVPIVSLAGKVSGGQNLQDISLNSQQSCDF